MGAFWLILTHDLLEDRPHFYVIWSLILNRCRATWNLSVLWKFNREQLTSTLLTTTEVQICMNQNLVRNTHKCVFILLLLTPEIRKNCKFAYRFRNIWSYKRIQVFSRWSLHVLIENGRHLSEGSILHLPGRGDTGIFFFFFSPTPNFLMALSRVRISTEW